MSTYEERRDTRLFANTKQALKDIHKFDQTLPEDGRYPVAYGTLRGYFEVVLVNFAEAFSEEQLAEIRIVLDQLARLTREDEHLDKATKAKQDQLAQVLRESEE
jgi:hypothetical protein